MIRNNIDNIFQFVLFFLISSPVFISLNISNGLRFDANPFNLLGLPSIPISLIILFLISILHIKFLIKNLSFLILFFSMLIFLFFNFINGSGIRASIVFLGMLLPIISYIIFSNFIKYKANSYKIFYNVLFCIFILKLSTDMIVFGNIITPMFIIDSILIYNYYDYFPFFYYLLFILSIYNLINGLSKFFSLVAILFIIIISIYIDSRLYQIGIILSPLLFLIYKLINLRLSIYYNIFFTITIAITLIIGLLDININEASLSERFNHWTHYLYSFNLLTIIFPFYNDYRTGYASFGTLHNEFLEQFSYFGIIIFYYYFVIIKELFLKINNKFKFISFLLMFILIIGMLIQSNFSNPYIAILFGLLMAVLKHNHKGV